MNISSVSNAQISTESISALKNAEIKQAVSTSMLKKSLEGAKEEVDFIEKSLSGMGNVIDTYA